MIQFRVPILTIQFKFWQFFDEPGAEPDDEDGTEPVYGDLVEGEVELVPVDDSGGAEDLPAEDANCPVEAVPVDDSDGAEDLSAEDANCPVEAVPTAAVLAAVLTAVLPAAVLSSAVLSTAVLTVILSAVLTVADRDEAPAADIEGKHNEEALQVPAGGQEAGRRGADGPRAEPDEETDAVHAVDKEGDQQAREADHHGVAGGGNYDAVPAGVHQARDSDQHGGGGQHDDDPAVEGGAHDEAPAAGGAYEAGGGRYDAVPAGVHQVRDSDQHGGGGQHDKDPAVEGGVHDKAPAAGGAYEEAPAAEEERVEPPSTVAGGLQSLADAHVGEDQARDTDQHGGGGLQDKDPAVEGVPVGEDQTRVLQSQEASHHVAAPEEELDDDLRGEAGGGHDDPVPAGDKQAHDADHRGEAGGGHDGLVPAGDQQTREADPNVFKPQRCAQDLMSVHLVCSSPKQQFR